MARKAPTYTSFICKESRFNSPAYRCHFRDQTLGGVLFLNAKHLNNYTTIHRKRRGEGAVKGRKKFTTRRVIKKIYIIPGERKKC